MVGKYIQKVLKKARESAIFLLVSLSLFLLMSLGMAGRAWAVTETVKTFGLVEKEGVGGPFTQSDSFNDGSVVYVRVDNGSQMGSSYDVTIIDDAYGGNRITITVYDNGYLPDEDNNDTYYWGKFILRQGNGSGTSDALDILELSNGEIAIISADLNGVGTGFTTITADYDGLDPDVTPPDTVDHSDHISPVMSLSINHGTFSPDGDGVQDTATISFTLDDNVSSSLYTRVEIRDSSSDYIIKRNILIPSSTDNPLSTGSHSYIWDGKDDNGNCVADATYVVYLISVDDAENSAQRTAEVIVETIKPEIVNVGVNPSTISPQNGDGSYDISTITFTTTNAGAELTFKIYAEPACTTLVRDLTSGIESVAGVDHYSVTWDGKDDAGSYVNDGTYTCRIYAKSLTGEETTNTEGTVTVDNTVPSAPTNLSATAASGGNIQLTWTASSSTDVAQYNIYRATTSGGQNYSSPTYTILVGTNSYTDTSTSDGVTYYYVVRAQDSVGNIETNTNEAWATAGATGAPSFSSITSDKSAYKDGDTITLTVTLANHDTGCTLTADFSNIDDQYVSGGESVVNWGTDGRDNDGDGHVNNPAEQGVYVISYLISTVNSKADGSHSVPVTATDEAENSTSSSISLTLGNTTPSAPTNLSATAASGGGIKLTWTASSIDVAQYNIYRATTSGGQNYTSPTYTVLVGTTTYTDTSTSDGVTYYYVVRAQDTLGNEETNTNEAWATAGATGAPSFSSITSDKSAYKDGDTITLTVTLANHDTGCTLTADFSNIDDQYVSGGESVVNWGTDGRDNDGDGHVNNPAEQGIYVISYLISTVNSKADGSHSVPVTATNGAENSTSSSIGLTLDNTAPSAPTNLSATALSGGSIKLAWTASSSSDISQYNIYRATSPGGENYTSPTYTVSVETNSYTDTSTTDGVTYYYVVRAQDAAGNIETNTNETSATTSGTTGPSPPTNLTATAIAGGIQLTWTASSSSNVAQYNIYRATTSGGQDYTSPTYTVSVGTTSYTDTSTTDGVTYYYVIRAQDTAGDIETNTNEVSATADIPDTTPPPIPYFEISPGSTTGKIVISGTTGADASQPQEVEIFLNGNSQGTVTANADGDFSKEITLVQGDNSITLQAIDNAGNKSSLSDSLKLSYKPENLLSIVIRSTHVVRSDSSTEPIKVFYSVSQSALVTIYIYNLKGELVKEESQECAGSGEWNWHGKNMYEEDVNNGVYILRVTASAGSESETVTKLVGVLR